MVLNNKNYEKSKLTFDIEVDSGTARNYGLIKVVANGLGTYNPEEVMPHIVDKMYEKDVENIIMFLYWVHETQQILHDLDVFRRIYREFYHKFS